MKNPNRLTLLLLLSAALLAGCGRASPAPAATQPTVQPGESEHALTVGGLERTYLLHIPPGLVAGQPVALVFALHGAGQTGSYIRQYSGLGGIADANGFLLVYPNGTRSVANEWSQTWNTGECCGYAYQNEADDVGFVRAMLADLRATFNIDSQRVYATGFSNGAMFAYDLACEMSDTFAAIAPVSGALLSDSCQPAEPVAVLHMHGLKDRDVPYAGGSARTPILSGFVFPPLEQSIAAWVRLDGCTDPAQVEQEGLVTHTTYGSCENDTTVELYTVEGIDHSWPPAAILPAAQIIWDFFAAHPKP